MQPVLEVRQLSKRYGTGKRTLHAVSEVSFSASRGEILGILGPNGSGKTTTLKAIAGLTTCDAGEILVNGRSIRREPERALFDLGALLEGSRNVYWRLSPRANLRYFAGIRGLPRAEAESRASALIGTLRLDEYEGQEVRMLSRGNQQKVALACALIHRPALLMLDEPTLGLDVETVRAMRDWLRELLRDDAACMLLTSHDLDFIEQVCDRVLIMFRGRLVSVGTVEELRRRYRPRKRLALRVEGRVGNDTLRQLQALAPWQLDEPAEGSGHSELKVQVPDFDCLADTLAALQRARHRLQDLRVHEDSLEELFLHLIEDGAAAGPEHDGEASV